MAPDASGFATSTGAVRAVLGIGLATLVLTLCLFGDCPPVIQLQALGSILAEVTASFGDPGTQWMVFACVGLYLVGFVVLRRRPAGGAEASGSGGLRVEGMSGSSVRAGWGLAAQWPGEPAFWLAGSMVLAALAYALDYAEAVRPSQALTLVGAALVGQGVGFFQSRKQKVESTNGGGGIVFGLVLLLAGAAVWQGEAGHLFQYQTSGDKRNLTFLSLVKLLAVGPSG